MPVTRPGWVLVRVRAFGLNRAELITRSGGSGDAVRFPRVIGIECVGEVVEDPDGELRPGQTVVAAMGEMGRAYDGGYQQYTLLPAAHVIPVKTTLRWETLGAIPETFATAWGALEELRLAAGDSVLIHGGTSSVGMAAITIAKDSGLTVFATTRQESKGAALTANGADHVIVDDGSLAAKVLKIAPGGVTGLVELVGAVAVIDALNALAPGGRACIAGYLEDEWDLAPAQAAARGLAVPLAVYSSSVVDRASYGQVLQRIIDAVQQGRYRVNLDRTFEMAEIADAHRYMEGNRAVGKIVVLTRDD
ncbi:MAG: NADPH:quinone reductase [Solirubrobacterales bacterium]|nr:NADPH:quinone reductase [Solirubrobacterales bacterium]